MFNRSKNVHITTKAPLLGMCCYKTFFFQILIKMKNNVTTIILFLGALIWFVIFALDYTYHKDFMTWMHLLASITW
jgi:hypothetical protein